MGICPFLDRQSNTMFPQCQGPDCQMWDNGGTFAHVSNGGYVSTLQYVAGCGLIPREDRKV